MENLGKISPPPHSSILSLEPVHMRSMTRAKLTFRGSPGTIFGTVFQNGPVL